jgi:hypothetical protein
LFKADIASDLSEDKTRKKGRDSHTGGFSDFVPVPTAKNIIKSKTTGQEKYE